MTPELEERIRRLPDRPGIYVFRGERRRVLYVGKAKSLRKRALSYLSRAHDPRLAAMVDEARSIEVVVAASEAEALLLENNWIKEKRPRYNVLLRDDKTYPYLKLTREPWPLLAFTRRIRRDGADYFGPYLPAGRARKAIKLVQKLFGIRVCTIEIDGSLPRPCLYWDMRRCLGPCVEGLTSVAAYAEAVEEARLFLAGRTRQLVQRLKGEMRRHSAAEEFEQAARVRDLIAEVEALDQRQNLSSTRGEDADIFGVHLSGGNAAVTVLVMRGGQVLDRRELFWEGRKDLSEERLLSELLPQFYDRTTFIPKEIHLPFEIEGQEVLVEWLESRKEERVYVRLPVRGPKARRMELAKRNAELAHRRRFRTAAKEADVAIELAERLGMSDPPRRIEGFDISNFQGSETVASMVVWEEGRILKKDYRSFNIRGLDQPDDFAAIRQAVSRRYRRRLEEVGAMPDLILIDGGRGQLNAALEALAELGVEETPICGLAKREEEIYLPSLPEPLRLDRKDAALLLLQRVRDEAHRFAVDRHRRRRRRATMVSRLDEIEGIGPGRRKRLLQRFGSLAGVRAASLQELQDAVGRKTGRRVHEALLEAETEVPVDSPRPPAGDP